MARVDCSHDPNENCHRWRPGQWTVEEIVAESAPRTRITLEDTDG